MDMWISKNWIAWKVVTLPIIMNILRPKSIKLCWIVYRTRISIAISRNK